MNTQYFRYALEVERERSISRAADKLFLSQPSLSKVIREMEDTLGYALFERSSRGVVPTPEGRKFLVSARRIVAELQKVEAISLPGKPDTLTLRLSLPRVGYLAEGFAAWVANLDPSQRMDVSMQETNSLQAMNNVANGLSNLGALRCHAAYEPYFLDALRERRLQSELLWESDYWVLFSNRHPLADVPALSADSLRQGLEIRDGDDFVPYLSPNESVRPPEPQAADRHVFLLDRAGQLDLLSRIPDAYRWDSPQPKSLLTRYALVQRECAVPGHRFRDLLVFPEGYRFTDLDRRLVDRLYAAKNEAALDSAR